MIRFVTCACLTALLIAFSGPAFAQELAPPFRLKCGDEFIDTDIGHSAPYIADFDGDGLDDLLVGQFGEGKLRIYRNVGSNKAPRYEKLNWFEAGGELAKVPTG